MIKLRDGSNGEDADNGVVPCCDCHDGQSTSGRSGDYFHASSDNYGFEWCDMRRSRIMLASARRTAAIGDTCWIGLVFTPGC
ncbi:MAG: hypothetical protein ACLVEF_07870 [Bifidobacterium bifidum]